MIAGFLSLKIGKLTYIKHISVCASVFNKFPSTIIGGFLAGK